MFIFWRWKNSKWKRILMILGANLLGKNRQLLENDVCGSVTPNSYSFWSTEWFASRCILRILYNLQTLEYIKKSPLHDLVLIHHNLQTFIIACMGLYLFKELFIVWCGLVYAWPKLFAPTFLVNTYFELIYFGWVDFFF